ncbi:hypothetical protein [Phormidium sp. FACHB-1136]|jgi:hypothetical protein|uniref:hypothetical protein n=1 Tax=Phormidium sp. FACHB-1136 TaxID=2692848 RepID=UPI001683E526|nr:hypothetical protein [Phormidium sp. FACHB-1136]MBD2424892.1 hypothetical protein [Phormidium sp. FACHB-1136]
MDQVIQGFFVLLVQMLHWIRPFLVPLCFVVAWGLVGITVWQLIAVTRDGMQRAKRMHQIPCADCRYFTNSPFLKCPLHPQTALSEAAIDCGDYETNDPMAQGMAPPPSD